MLPSRVAVGVYLLASLVNLPTFAMVFVHAGDVSSEVVSRNLWVRGQGPPETSCKHCCRSSRVPHSANIILLHHSEYFLGMNNRASGSVENLSEVMTIGLFETHVLPYR